MTRNLTSDVHFTHLNLFYHPKNLLLFKQDDHKTYRAEWSLANVDRQKAAENSRTNYAGEFSPDTFAGRLMKIIHDGHFKPSFWHSLLHSLLDAFYECCLSFFPFEYSSLPCYKFKSHKSLLPKTHTHIIWGHWHVSILPNMMTWVQFPEPS